MEIRHYRFDRITLDSDKCFGKPCIRGMRMPIASILSYLSSGMNEDTILEAWPELEREDIRQALGYAAWAMEERVVIAQNEILAEHERTEGAP
ncbi:DUF433 domain-containing protein [Candidatus Poribacteria bacterium]|nr:DUF433 domain-containing protein [Candidatus Poribacteria bacterium]